jgi:hypothetical protein
MKLISIIRGLRERLPWVRRRREAERQRRYIDEAPF